MSETNRNLIRRLGNEIAPTEHMLRAIELDMHGPAAEPDGMGALLERMRARLQRNVSELRGLLDALEGSLEGRVEDELAAETGFVTGLYARFRGERPSRLLTAHHVALGISAVSYVILHATALALGEDAVADLASRHLKTNRELVVDINRVLAEVVIQEIDGDGHGVDPDAAPATARAFEEAWCGDARSPAERGA